MIHGNIMDLQVLQSDNAKLSPRDVDMVLLVGRASRMPRVRSLLTEFFGGGPSVLSYAVRALSTDTSAHPQGTLAHVTKATLSVFWNAQSFHGWRGRYTAHLGCISWVRNTVVVLCTTSTSVRASRL
jgi:Hsp70 protein